MRRRQISAAFLATVAAVTLVVAGAALGGTVAADSHTYDEAPDLTEHSNFTVVLPHATDHYPGSQNEHNASIEYFASGGDAFEEMGAAEEGVFFDYIEVTADWIDYSECSSDNTYAFGIDRGNNNDGVQFDDDLLEYQRANNFFPGGIQIWFFNWNDFGDVEPPHMNAEDAVVAGQGAGSAGGACLHMTDEEGWYQIQAFVNGTIADNGPDEQPSADAEMVAMHLRSNYIYVCDCDSEAEAREELGPPPDEQGGEPADDPTPTPTPEPDDERDQEDQTDQQEQDDQQQDDEQQDSDQQQDDGQQAANGGETQDEGTAITTPTPGDGPGFGPLMALGALLAAALLLGRRR